MNAEAPELHRIAVIDDDPILVAALSELLVREGYGVESAGAFDAAIAMIARFRPELVLLDYTIPGTTAADLVPEIRRGDPIVQVVLVTGASEVPARHLLAQLDIQGFHAKGDGTTRLLIQIEAALKRHAVLAGMERQQRYLRHIVDAAPEIARLQPLDALLSAALRNLGMLLGSEDGVVVTANNGLFLIGEPTEAISVQAAIGSLSGTRHVGELPTEAAEAVHAGLSQELPAAISGYVAVPMRTRTGDRGCLVVRTASLPDEAIQACRLYAHHVVQALENVVLYERATVDPLTRIYNRGFGTQRLDESVRLASRTGTPVSVVMIDVDHFKHVNDRHGRAAGDLALRRIAQAVYGCCRSTDVVARYGGEELLLILPATDETGARVLAERVLRTVADLGVVYDGGELRVTVSAGVATTNAEVVDSNALLREAEAALYRAKAMGRNRSCSSGAELMEGLRIA